MVQATTQTNHPSNYWDYSIILWANHLGKKEPLAIHNHVTHLCPHPGHCSSNRNDSGCKQPLQNNIKAQVGALCKLKYICNNLISYYNPIQQLALVKKGFKHRIQALKRQHELVNRNSSLVKQFSLLKIYPHATMHNRLLQQVGEVDFTRRMFGVLVFRDIRSKDQTRQNCNTF